MKLPAVSSRALLSIGIRPAFACVAALALADVTAQAADLTWDTGTPPAFASGAGTWDNGITTNWTNDGGVTDMLWSSALDNAIFTTTAGGYTVTPSLASSPTVNNISFTGAATGGVTFANVAGAAITLNGSLTVGSTNTVRLDSKLSGTGSLIVNGGTLLMTTLNSTNNFSGGVTLNSGTYTIRTGSQFGSGPLTINGGTFTDGSQNFSLSNSLTIGGNFTVNVAGASTFSGAVDLGAGVRTISNSGNNLLFTGVVSGTGGFNFTGTGLKNVVLQNALNTFEGGVTVNAGVSLVLKTSGTAVGNSSPLGNKTSSVLTVNGGSLASGNNDGNRTYANNIVVGGDFALTAGTGTITTFSGAVDLGGAARVITVGSSTGTLVLSGVISGTGGAGLTLAGGGGGTKVTLSGVNTYTGATTVGGGTLALGSSGTLASTSYSIADGAVFNASAKTSYSLAAVATTIGVGATTSGFFNGPSSGALTLGNSLTLNFSTNLIADGQTYNLFDFGSKSGDFSSVVLTGSIVGSLLLTDTDTWTGLVGGYDFTFHQDTGNLLVATAVPEPSTYAAILGSLALVGVAIHRRRRQG
ncbi:MAG: PEP-CTERM sorting domain-containing protein [Opitutaceae bacterium]|jgi:autotransporter-associated beta strand protein